MDTNRETSDQYVLCPGAPYTKQTDTPNSSYSRLWSIAAREISWDMRQRTILDFMYFGGKVWANPWENLAINANSCNLF
jgi:hypothetical protein